MTKQQKEDYSDLLAEIGRALNPEKPKAKSKFDWFIFLFALAAVAVVAIAYFKN